VPVQYRNSPCHKKADYLLASATSYENSTVRALIWQLKFRHRLSVLPELAELLNKTLNNLGMPLQDFVLIPIPLHASRLRERGFNQSELLANLIADSNHLTVDSSSLQKNKKTKAQIAMKNHKQRQGNLRGVFSLSEKNSIAGKNIILIDDVWTSGATMNEVSAVLKAGGAKKIIGLVVAKAG
jgi:ComF family protein